MFEGDVYTDMISYCSVLLFRVQRTRNGRRFGFGFGAGIFAKNANNLGKFI